MNQPNLNDPRKMFYTEKFPQQEQKHPALQKDMTPQPDCGESSYTGSGKLEGRNALVTGGDSGIGRAAAIAYAREGADVAIQYLPGEEEDAEAVKTIIENEGRKAVLLGYDFKEKGQATKMVEEAVEMLGSIEVVVLNAAQQIAQPDLQALSIDQVQDTFQVNIISMFEAIKAVEPYLKAGASVITTTSVQSFDPTPSLIDYAATNGAVSNFTIALADYFAPKGIRVNGVAPGPIWTPLQLAGGQLKGDLPGFGQGSHLQRAGQPVELAPTYVLLASDDGSYISGQIFGVTGGKAIDL